MKHQTLLLRALLAILALCFLTGTALALSARATVGLNVRSGPGTGYGVVDVLRAGESVEISECTSNRWCYIRHPGNDGWVSGRYLAPINYNQPEEQNCTFTLTIGPDGPSFSASCTSPGGGIVPRPPVSPRPPIFGSRVCFYKDAGYRGDRFCADQGESDNFLSRDWRNSISSIRMTGGGRLRVCTFSNMLGFCANYTSSQPNLSPLIDNRITSFKVY